LAVELCNWLIEQGAKVRVHDPVVEELPTKWHGIVQRFDEALGALDGAQVLLVGTEWPEYREIPKDCVTGAAPGLVVLDPNRFLSSLGTAAALRYVAVGTPSLERLV
jgi:UDPglucose 6-dehydrogenase